MTRRETQLNTFVRQARDLYSLPAVAVEVLALADDSQADAGKLKALIERDPALSAKLLRVVNSSLFGLARPVADLHQAIALLGVKALKLLVLGFSLPERMFAAKEADVLRSYWTRTLTRAVAARELARVVGAGHDDEAFLAGLLGDLGILVFIQEGGERYANLYRRSLDDTAPLAANERRYYGFDHTDLTLRLMADWKLPPALIVAVEQGLSLLQRAKEDSLQEGPTELAPQAALLRAADRLATIVVDGRTELWPELVEDEHVRRRLTAEQLADLAEAVQQKVDQLGRVLHVEVGSEHSYRDVLHKAHRRMLTASEEVVEELLRRRRAAIELGDADPVDDSAERELFRNLGALRDEARESADGAASFTAMHRELHPAGETHRTTTNASDAATTARRGMKSSLAGTRSPFSAPAALHDRLEEALALCRRTRVPLSLVLVELDRFDELRVKLGPVWEEYAVATFEDACRSVEHPRWSLVRESAQRWGIVLPGTERIRTLRLVDEILRRYRQLCPLDVEGSTTLSCGTATVNAPPVNFPLAELLTAAERCLYAAQCATGDTSKSIELC